MNAQRLSIAVSTKRKAFHAFIDKIKTSMPLDVYSISNITIIKNPYTSIFPLNYFLKKNIAYSKTWLFLKSTLKFYVKQFYFFLSYIITFFLFKLYFKKKHVEHKGGRLIDVFFLVQTVINEEKLNERYFNNLYELLDKNGDTYSFIPRIYNTDKNPFSLVKFFKILSKDERNFLFEFELITFMDFMYLFTMIVAYPFKTLRLLQDDDSEERAIFNHALLQDISSQGMNTFSRYIFGKNIAKLESVNQIYSWSEFQVIERSFNYAIRKKRDNIELVGCQFYLNYENYFNACVDDIDGEHGTAFDKVLVNGRHYMMQRDIVKYQVGVSLRYKDIFNHFYKNENFGILLLGSYIEKDTKDMLNNVSQFDNIFFKNHPAVNLDRLGVIDENIRIATASIYELFKDINLVIVTASGTAVEAVACGRSVIIMASQNNLTSNPLVSYGKGKIWDIAFSEDDVKTHYNKLIKYREENLQEIKNIAQWYRDNFFVEPTEENIIKVFEL